ncbi:MAG: hypothetical protein WA354_09570 [Terracidiphilus sp.]
MTVRNFVPILLLIAAPLLAQAPAVSSLSNQDFGFTYHLPAGWDPIDTQATLPEVKKRQMETAKTEDEKKEIACVQIPISARRGAPPSFLAAMALPFDCFGQIMTEKDLPGFAEGSSEGPRAIFDFADPVYGSYSMGSHHIWIERAKGNPKGHPEMPYTLEIACSLLKKAAVCWMTVAGDDQSLKEFEGGAITLDGDFFPELVPATAFEKKPAS